MRTFSEIYNNIVSSFKKRTNLDITKGTVLDSYLLATTEGLAAAHQEIEDSKNPHIYTNLKGKNIDKMDPSLQELVKKSKETKINDEIVKQRIAYIFA